MIVTVWVALATTMDCCNCGAARKFPLPAWLALITHVPPAMKVTVEPAIVQTAAADASIVNATAKPEVAVAATL